MSKKMIYFSCIILLLSISSASRADLVAYYPFDEGSGDIATDASGNGHNGTATGLVWIEGPEGFGNAVYFEGTNPAPNYINCGTWDPSEGTDQLTVALWVRWDGPRTDDNFGGGPLNQGIVAKRNTYGAGQVRWNLAMNSTSPYYLKAGNYDLTIGTGGEVLLPQGEWTYVAFTCDGTTGQFYINGVLIYSADFYLGTATDAIVVIGCDNNNGFNGFYGGIDDVRMYNTALSEAEIVALMTGVSKKGFALGPKPSNRKSGVSIDVGEISWKPGEYVEANGGTHNVFFGTDKDSVTNATTSDPMGTTMYPDLDVNSVEIARLMYDTTYYWRVDEVNLPSNPGTVEGNIWSFTTEPEGIDLEPETIIDVTASENAIYPHEQEPNVTCNENGLDANDMHSTVLGTMWLGMGDNPGEVWIQYEFDKIYKFHELQVWNYNEPTPSETFGAKDVNVTYSQDAGTWKALDDIVEFEVATGDDSYTANTFVDMDGAVAKYIRLTFLNSWTEDLYTGGISEIRFSVIPTRAAVPSPEDEDEDIEVDSVLGWEAGRDADIHKVYIGSDPNSVRDGIADIIDETTEASYAPVLGLARTYYWKVDEVNEVEEYTTWDGPVWSFSTVAYIVIDNFEVGYGNTAADAVYKTWKDAIELVDSTNGSTMGRPSPPYLHTINHSGGHSAPMTYDTLTHDYSEVIAQSADLPIGTSDWSIGSPSTLTIWFRGDPNTTEVGDSEMYCTIGGKTAVYGGDIATLTRTKWYQWDIDLTTLSANLSNIPQITIGIRKVGSTGGSGVIYLDDIQLTGLPAQVVGESFWREAEDYDDITGDMIVTDTWTAVNETSGGKYVTVDPNVTTAANDEPNELSVVSYEFEVEGGQYMINCRKTVYMTNNSFWVKVVGDNVVTDVDLHESGWARWENIPYDWTTAQLWRWDPVWNTNDAGENQVITWTLSAGTYTLEFTYKELGARLDVIEFVKIGE